VIVFAKIVKGESRDKRKTKFFSLTMPSRILFYSKIVKGESRDKRKTKFFGLTMPSRILFYLKIAKERSNAAYLWMLFVDRQPMATFLLKCLCG